MTSKKVTVLAIEDDPGDIHILRRCMEDIPGWDVKLLAFTEAADGLAHLSQHETDIVLLDYLLGATTGLEVLKIIQNSGCKCPVVILTGHGHEELAAELMRYGAADYLPKNRLSANSLKRVISNALAKHKLQESLEEHRRNLQQANVDLLRRNQEIQNFYHRLAYKLKSPATSARGYVSMLLDGSAGRVADIQREHLKMVEDSCNEICACVKDLVDVTDLQRGEFAVYPSPHCIHKLVREVMASAAPAAQKKGIRLKDAVERDLPQLHIDENSIKRVLSSLLGNALKFTPNGGQITVKVTDNLTAPEFVLVSVTDTGRGIEQDKLPYIFDRLYQATEGDWMNHQGLGLGLYISRELIRLHGGDISVRSEPGQGSTFSFTLPKHVPQETPRAMMEKASAHK